MNSEAIQQVMYEMGKLVDGVYSPCSTRFPIRYATQQCLVNTLGML